MQADKIISDSHLDKEYSAIHGDAEFCKLVAQLAFGDNSSIVKDGLVNMLPVLWNISAADVTLHVSNASYGCRSLVDKCF